MKIYFNGSFAIPDKQNNFNSSQMRRRLITGSVFFGSTN